MIPASACMLAHLAPGQEQRRHGMTQRGRCTMSRTHARAGEETIVAVRFARIRRELRGSAIALLMVAATTLVVYALSRPSRSAAARPFICCPSCSPAGISDWFRRWSRPSPAC